MLPRRMDLVRRPVCPIFCAGGVLGKNGECEDRIPSIVRSLVRFTESRKPIVVFRPI